MEISCQATASLESGSSTILQSSFSIFQQILHYVGTYVVDIFKKSLIYYFSITGKARKQKREKVRERVGESERVMVGRKVAPLELKGGERLRLTKFSWLAWLICSR